MKFLIWKKMQEKLTLISTFFCMIKEKKNDMTCDYTIIRKKRYNKKPSFNKKINEGLYKYVYNEAKIKRK